MINHYILVALVYIAISLFITIVVAVINPEDMHRKLVMVFVVALIASFSGGIIYTSFRPIFDTLASLQKVNVYPPLLTASLATAILVKVLSQRDE